jgi:hypothetical protein
MVRSVLAGGLLGMVLLGGCAHQNLHPHGGRMIAEFKPGECPEVKKTPYQATYVLYHWPIPPCDPPPHKWVPEHEVVEMFVRGLGKRQPIGFEKGCDGKVFAVAGEEKIELDLGRYCWHMHPNTEYTGLKWLVHETGERAVEIIAVPFGLAATIIALPFGLAAMILFLPFFLLFFLFFWPFLLFAAV